MPDATIVWVVVAHKRFPFAEDVVVGGPYPDEHDADLALAHLQEHPQWFCTYTTERRLK